MRRSLALLLAVAACSGDTVGTLEVRLWGEDFIEQGIPASELVDGYAITFERFLVAIGEVRAKSKDDALVSEAVRVYELAAPSSGRGLLVASKEVATGAYDDVVYALRPADESTSAGNVGAEDVSLMTSGGFSLYVEGTASRDDDTLTFAWGFATSTRYAHCHGTAKVTPGGTARTLLTIHADHLFYDDLFSPEPNVAFAAIADADDGDGVVTREELLAYALGPLENYQVGSTGIANLWDFIAYQTTTIGHIDGEGHCEEVTVE